MTTAVPTTWLEYGANPSYWVGSVGLLAASGDPGWTVLSECIVAASIRRGRTTELDTVQAGSMTVTLGQPTALDPSDDSWNGRAVRFRCLRDGVTTTLFTGFIESVEADDDESDKYGTVTVVATDAFRRLSLSGARGYANLVLLDQPFAFYRLGEASGTTMYDSSGNDRDGTYSGTAPLADSLAAGGDGSRAFDGTSGTARVEGLTGLAFDKGAGDGITVECWFKTTATTFTLFTLNGTMHAGKMRFLEATYTGGQLTITLNEDGTGFASVQTKTIALADGTAHHLAISWSGFGWIIYCDGASIVVTGSFPAASTGDTRSANSLTLASTAGITGTGVAYYAITVDEFAIYDRALGTDEITRHYKAGSYLGTESTSTRATRVLDLIQWPGTYRSIETGYGTVGVQDSEADALSLLREAETAERGTLLVLADGTISLRNRRHRQTASASTTAQLTLSDATEAIGYLALPRRVDDGRYVNRVSVTWNTGAPPAVVSDDDGIQRFGVRPLEVTSLLSSRDDARDLAGDLIRRYGLLYLTSQRVERCEFLVWAGGSAVRTTFDTAVALDIDSRVALTRTPLDNPTLAPPSAYWVEGIEHTITSDGWYVALDLSPADLVPLLRLNSSAGSTTGTGLDAGYLSL